MKASHRRWSCGDMATSGGGAPKPPLSSDSRCAAACDRAVDENDAEGSKGGAAAPADGGDCSADALPGASAARMLSSSASSCSWSSSHMLGMSCTSPRRSCCSSAGCGGCCGPCRRRRARLRSDLPARRLVSVGCAWHRAAFERCDKHEALLTDGACFGTRFILASSTAHGSDDAALQTEAR
jgi:hypothetical protein